MTSPLDFNNAFLSTYLKYTEDTESPPLYHVWCALAGISATLGRRCFFDFGIGPLFPNLYVLLVGPPAVRKSTALHVITGRLKSATAVHFAPVDTSGKRQGLITALADGDNADDELRAAVDQALNTSVNMLEELGDIVIQPRTVAQKKDIHTMFIAASEFTSITGINNIEILTFLQMMYDGEDYPYKLKTESVMLNEPLVSLLGCTTATNIADALPPAAIGQGFMSRVLLVFQSKKHKDIPWPKKLDSELEKAIDGRLSEIQHKFEGPFTFDTSARALLTNLYGTQTQINDHRFVFYIERRQSHLLKVCMNMAAAEGTMAVNVSHVEDAQKLLAYTEHFMPEALGEFGLSPLAKAKQKLVDFIGALQEPVSMQVLWQIMHRDMTSREFPGALADLVNAGKLIAVTTDQGPAYMARGSSAKDLALIEALTETEE